VDLSYIAADENNEYYVASGGRCYKECDIWRQQRAMVKCPECGSSFGDEWAYHCHYDQVHRKIIGDS
jgi:hypothetical protein